MPASAVTLRDVTNLGYFHGKRGRFRAGTSVLLDVVLEPRAGDGFIIDVTTLAELTAVGKTPAGVSIGAFVTLDALAQRAPEIAPPGASASSVRLRLALLGAVVIVAAGGGTRRAAIDDLVLEPHELPIGIEVQAAGAGLGLGDRRRATADGAASYALGVSAALRIVAHRFADVRIIVELDEVKGRARLAEAKLLNQRADPGLFPEAARLAATTIAAVDARTSAAARAVLPLVTAALREALDGARTSKR